MEKIKIRQVRSQIGCPARQKRTLEALGLGKINSSNELEPTPQVLGMVRKVNHLITLDK